MSARRPLFLEGDRIVDAAGNTVRELPPGQRQLALRIARAHAMKGRARWLAGLEDDPLVGPVLAAAKRRLDGLSPEELEAARAGAAARMAGYRRQAEALRPYAVAEWERLLAEMERVVPDDPTARIPLTD